MNEVQKKALADAERLVREVAAGLGIEIVEFTFRSQGKHSLMRIDVDRVGVPGAGIADCEALSRAIDAPLEAIEFFGGGYELQVSTPGIDRPIRTDDDLRRNAGRLVRLEYRDEDGRVKEAHGVLAPAKAGQVQILAENGDISVPRDRVVVLKQDIAMARRPGKGR